VNPRASGPATTLYTVVCGHPIDLPGGVQGCYGQTVELNPDDALPLLVEGSIVVTPESGDSQMTPPPPQPPADQTTADPAEPADAGIKENDDK
jgi:hypothetical protein